MAERRADPGGHFDSDLHRRVLGHLSEPSEDYGWQIPNLRARLVDDSSVPDDADLEAVLDELKSDGHAKLHKGGIWQMTKKGYELLTGPIHPSLEPPEGTEPTPVRIDGPTPLKSTGRSSTKLKAGT